jgi:acyl-CoA hydrolase
LTGIPNLMLVLTKDRRHLGIRTEMLTDGVVELYRAGAVDGSRKAVMPGAGVVTSRGDVRHVVTGHGRVGLFGMGAHKRAEALISIAHPDFREELARRARELHLT